MTFKEAVKILSKPRNKIDKKTGYTYGELRGDAAGEISRQTGADETWIIHGDWTGRETAKQIRKEYND